MLCAAGMHVVRWGVVVGHVRAGFTPNAPSPPGRCAHLLYNVGIPWWCCRGPICAQHVLASMCKLFYNSDTYSHVVILRVFMIQQGVVCDHCVTRVDVFLVMCPQARCCVQLQRPLVVVQGAANTLQALHSGDEMQPLRASSAV